MVTLALPLRLPGWVCLASCLAAIPSVQGQAPLQFVQPVQETWEIGLVVEATGATTGIEASMPVPMDWPEQKVVIAGTDASPQVRKVSYRTLDNGVKQMLVSIPRLRAGETAQALVTFEVTKQMISGPRDTGSLHVPTQLDRKLRKYLLPSPYIESRDPTITGLAEAAIRNSQDDWGKVESIFDWVRDNIRYEFDVQIKGALKAVEDGHGDCEELTSLFVAMCRANQIPARAVWIPDHCYPEFYLVDSDGIGHWFPCQAAGQREFGSMTERKPILQKGDQFRVPGERQTKRYVAETLRARNAQSDPRVQFVRRRVTASGGQAPTDPAHSSVHPSGGPVNPSGTPVDPADRFRRDH